MSDPNCNQFVSDKTLLSLDILANNNYPVIVSTKNPERFIFSERNISNSTIIQVSFSTINPRLSKELEPGVPSPQNRIKAIKALVEKGYRITARIQPFFYCLKEEIFESLIPYLIQVGVDHIIFEHLKLPIETRSRKALFNLCKKSGLSLELYEMFGTVYGRSIVLSNEVKLENILKVKKICEKNNITFGAGDYGFYHFSSTNCCCGIDKFFPESNWFKGNFTNIIKCTKGNQLLISELDKYDYPYSSISSFINSHSRIDNNCIKQLLINKWNRPGTANAIDTYYGIKLDSYFDDYGNKVFYKEDVLWI